MNSDKRLAFLSSFILTFFTLALLVSLAVAQEKTATPHSAVQPAEAKLGLHDGWSLQSSAKIEAKPEVISTTQYATKGWLAVAVPTTVVAAQVKNKILPDPYSGMNLRSFPGVTYP